VLRFKPHCAHCKLPREKSPNLPNLQLQCITDKPYDGISLITALITRERIHLLILTREFPREPLRRAADPLQGVGGIQYPAFQRAVEYLDRRLAGRRAAKSIAETYLSVDFTMDPRVEIRRFGEKILHQHLNYKFSRGNFKRFDNISHF